MYQQMYELLQKLTLLRITYTCIYDGFQSNFSIQSKWCINIYVPEEIDAILCFLDSLEHSHPYEWDQELICHDCDLMYFITEVLKEIEAEEAEGETLKIFLFDVPNAPVGRNKIIRLHY